MIVPATQVLAEEYWAGRPGYSFRGYVAVLDGAPIGAAGIFRALGKMWAFSEMAPAMRPFKKTRVRAVQKLVLLLDSMPCSVYATSDPKEETSPKLLARLGFTPTGEYLDGNEILVRRP